MVHILENPHIFNFVISVIAGKQENTKRFVQDTIKKYHCKNIFDICCGTGNFASSCGSSHYYGIDISHDYINYAKKKYKDDTSKEFKVINVLKEPISLHNFDCALLVSTLHHFSDKDLDIIFTKLKRIVKGILIVADLDDSPSGFLRTLMLRLDRGNYIRSNSQKILLLKKYFKVMQTKSIESKLAVQYGIVSQNL